MQKLKNLSLAEFFLGVLFGRGLGKEGRRFRAKFRVKVC